MMTSHPALSPIQALDLSSVCARLAHPDAGPGWDEQRIRDAEAAYREFLLMAKLFPCEAAVPGRDVDTFWHFHILDTARYARDCASVFGHFLHHAPDTVARRVAHGSAPSAARAALTTRRMMTMSSRGAAANQGAYCAVAGGDPLTTPMPAGATPEQAYCALTAASSDGGSETAYCALSNAPLRPRQAQGAPAHS